MSSWSKSSRPDMDPTTSLFIVALALAVLGIVYKRKSSLNLPPVPTRALPILGHALLLKMKNPRKQIDKWRKQCGDVFSLYLGQRLVVIISGYEAAREAFVKNAHIFSDRPPIQFDMGHDNESYGLATNSGVSFREQKCFCMSVLRRLGMGQNSQNDQIQREITLFLDELGKHQGEATDALHGLSYQVFSNVVFSLTTGKRFDYHQPDLVQVIKNMRAYLACPPHMATVQLYSFLSYLPGDFFRLKWSRNTLEELFDFFRKHFVDNAEVNSAEVDGIPSNLVSAYFQEMAERKRQEKPTYMSRKNLEKMLLDLMGAALETSSHTLIWFVMFCINFPEKQEKAFLEIKKHISTDRLPSMSDKKNLKYVNAFLLETWRLGNVTPISLPHMSCKDAKLKGYDVPKNSIVIFYMASTCFDSKIWGEDADVFRPERFLGEEGQLLPPKEFVPFSLGRRACPGESLARMEIFLLVAALLQRFRILPQDPQSMPPLEENFELLPFHPAFKARFVPR